MLMQTKQGQGKNETPFQPWPRCLSHNYPLLQFHEQPYHQRQKQTIILNLTSNLHILQQDPLERSMVWKLRQAECTPQIPLK
jgi:hypothetical protein